MLHRRKLKLIEAKNFLQIYSGRKDLRFTPILLQSQTFSYYTTLYLLAICFLKTPARYLLATFAALKMGDIVSRENSGRKCLYLFFCSTISMSLLVEKFLLVKIIILVNLFHNKANLS